jgi:hypothetical protein
MRLAAWICLQLGGHGEEVCELEEFWGHCIEPRCSCTYLILSFWWVVYLSS